MSINQISPEKERLIFKQLAYMTMGAGKSKVSMVYQ